MAPSSLSTARRAPIWQAQPQRRGKYQALGRVLHPNFPAAGSPDAGEPLPLVIKPGSQTCRHRRADRPVTRSLAASAADARRPDIFTACSVVIGSWPFWPLIRAFKPSGAVTVSISFAVTYRKIITVYTAGNPGGIFTAASGCPDGAPSVSTSSAVLRAVVS